MTDPLAVIRADVAAWLAEDIGAGDVTSLALVPADARCAADILLKESGVVSSLDVVRAIFAELDPGIAWEPDRDDGELVGPGRLARLFGRARAILAGERLALNVLGRMSGIATLTRRFVDAVDGTGATILDTRKTTPGLRALEKAAVRTGGGVNHRLGLYDAILIKDNHLRFVADVGEAVVRARSSGLPVEVECETLAQVRAALDARVDRILLDNMGPERLADAVALVAHRIPLEASGGVSLDTVRAIAETGVDFISIGALTHAARSLDVSLEIVA